jgi:predicted nuclease with TOPRIM domain
MSDDEKPDDKETTARPKMYSEEEFKEAVAARDKAKAKLREREEEDRKALETKAIEEGKLKEVLASKEAELSAVRKELEAVETARKEARLKALDKVPEEFKRFAERFMSADEIKEFLETLDAKKVTTHSTNAPKTQPEQKEKRTLTQLIRGDTGGLIPNLKS